MGAFPRGNSGMRPDEGRGSRLQKRQEPAVNRPFCFVFGIADAQHADIVGLIGAAGKFGYAGKGLMNEILGAVRGRIVEIVNQSFHAHFFPVLVGGFRQAVRVHQDRAPPEAKTGHYGT